MTAEIVVIECPMDEDEDDLGRTWVVRSEPLLGPVGMHTELQGLIGERAPEGRFYWEGWHDATVMRVDCFGAGYAESFEAALAAIRESWQRSPLADATPVRLVPAVARRRWSDPN